VGVSPAVFSDGKAVERNGPAVSAREVVNYAEGLSMRKWCCDRNQAEHKRAHKCKFLLD
jgi:hypothetical protein